MDSSRRLKILRVITWLPVGGIERRLVATLPRLDRERFDVSLVCIRERGPLAEELEAADIPVECVPLHSRWDPWGLQRLAGLMRERRIDIVHGHMYRGNVPATVAARLAGVRRVWCQVHNVDTWETRRQAWVDRRLCRWRSGMIAVSESVRGDVIETLRLPPERVRVIRNGVEIERFSLARGRRGQLRAERGVRPDQTVFLFAGRLVEQKRCRDFLDAFGRLQSEPAGEGLRAWIVGDGPCREALERQAGRLPRPDAVQFFSARDDVEDFMAAADVFVLPSTKEGFSNALVEAMASGLAIVATDVGGNTEAVRDGLEGRIVPPLKTDPLTEVLRALWREPELRRRLAEAARTRAPLFSLDRMITELEDLYTESHEMEG